MQAEDASRISAGGLTSSRLYTHAGAGATLSQLITDFGHTPNLVAFARLTAKAQDATARATEQDILLATDQAFYNSLEAQALVRVAEQTVKTRQDNSNLISQLTANKLKSDLDLSIAEADLSQSQLLLLDAESNRDTANSVLVALFNAQPGTLYAPVDDTVDNPAPPPAELDPLMSVALKQRPDYLASTLSQLAAEKFSKSQHEQYFPTISALGTAGFTPVRPDGVYVPNWFGAIGVNLSVPIFTGFRITAQAQEADLRAKAAAQQSLNLKNNIQRDVTTAFLQAKTAFQRVGVADQFAQHATQALSLAQARYQLGLSSIVELSQSQLQQTQAAVSAVNARYQYQLSLAALNYQAGYTP
jgi:outer membrane protein